MTAVYDAFHAPTPRHIEACPCCHDSGEYSVLFHKPLRELSQRDLANYAASVFLTAGSNTDFLYFLPRMLELSIQNTVHEHGLNPEIVLGKLVHAEWQNWHKSDRQVVMELIDAWFDNLIHADPTDGAAIEALLCGIARAGLSLRPYLEDLSQELDALIAFCEAQHLFLDRGRLSNAFWSDARTGADEVAEFLSKEPVKGLL